MPAVRNGSRLFAEWHIVILIAADLTRFLALAFGMVKATSSRTNLDWDTNSQTIDIKQYFPRS